jgi:hypothetical protein
MKHIDMADAEGNAAKRNSEIRKQAGKIEWQNATKSKEEH